MPSVVAAGVPSRSSTATARVTRKRSLWRGSSVGFGNLASTSSMRRCVSSERVFSIKSSRGHVNR